MALWGSQVRILSAPPASRNPCASIGCLLRFKEIIRRITRKGGNFFTEAAGDPSPAFASRLRKLADFRARKARIDVGSSRRFASALTIASPSGVFEPLPRDPRQKAAYLHAAPRRLVSASLITKRAVSGEAPRTREGQSQVRQALDKFILGPREKLLNFACPDIRLRTQNGGKLGANRVEDLGFFGVALRTPSLRWRRIGSQNLECYIE